MRSCEAQDGCHQPSGETDSDDDLEIRGDKPCRYDRDTRASVT